MKRLLAISVLLAFGPLSFATTRYIAQSAGTFSGGTACNGHTAITPATFNGVTNAAGDVNYICGTITASAGGGLLTVSGNGASGNPVQLIFDSGASLQAPYFSSASGAITVNGNYLTIDGGADGVIKNTANGTAKTYQQQSRLIQVNGSNFTVKNLQMLDVYVHTNGDANGDSSYNIYARGVSNTYIGPNNTFTQADVCILFLWDGGESNLTIDGNHFNGCNQSIEQGTSNAGVTSFTNTTISNNDATNWVNWDEPGNGYHHNFYHPFTNRPGSSLVGTLLVYNNILDGDIGQHSTSFIFIENNNGGSGGTMGTWYIFNNVFHKTNHVTTGGSGLVAPLSTNGYLVNNTFIDDDTSGNSYVAFHPYSSGWRSQNNIFVQNGYFVTADAALGTTNYNDYYNGQQSQPWDYIGSYVSTLSAWRSACSCDSASFTTNPNLTAGYIPNTGSPVIDTGANLTSLGITALNSDAAGTARPAVGAWTMGAFVYGAGPTTYTLSTSTTGTGTGTISCSPTGSGIASGTAVSCSVSADAGSSIAGVSGCGGTWSSSPYTFSMPAANCTAAATFTADIAVTVGSTGSGTGTLTGENCSTGSYPTGSTVNCIPAADPGSVFVGWLGDCSGLGNCTTSLSAPLTITANFVATTVQTLNLDDSLTTWAAVCVKPGCNPGGVDAPASTTQTINNVTPSIDGHSMLISETTNATSTQTNALWSQDSPSCDSCTNFVSEFYTQPTNGANASSLEFDSYKFDASTGRMYMWGMQCAIGGQWQIANSTSAWSNIGVTCSLADGSFHHVIVTDHMVFGDTSCTGGVGCLYFDTLTIDGVTHTLNLTLPSEALPGGWSSVTANQFQLDIGATTGTAKTVSANLDEVSFSGYIAGTNYTLSASVVGSGSISGTNCTSGTYASGTTIGACTATPGSGYAFSGWSGGSCSGTSTCTIASLASDATITATFTSIGPPAPPSNLTGVIVSGVTIQ